MESQEEQGGEGGLGALAQRRYDGRARVPGCRTGGRVLALLRGSVGPPMKLCEMAWSKGPAKLEARLLSILPVHIVWVFLRRQQPVDLFSSGHMTQL